MAWEEKYDIHWLLRWYHITELDTARIIAAATQVVQAYLRAHSGVLWDERKQKKALGLSTGRRFVITLLSNYHRAKTEDGPHN